MRCHVHLGSGAFSIVHFPKGVIAAIADKRLGVGLGLPFDFPAADSDEAGHRFRFEAGRGSDLSATWRLLPRIEVMMFGLAGSVKPVSLWARQVEKQVGLVTGGFGGGG
jgi:hypothetical protein